MKFIYVRTAKTGSSTLKDWCGTHIDITNNMKPLDEEKNREKIQKAFEERYTFFTSVRNPFTRAVSCWNQSIQSFWVPGDTTFEEYLQWDYTKNGDHCYTHNCPMTEYLSPYLGKIRIIIKMEELTNSLRKMEINYNIPEREIKFLNKAHYSKNFDYRGFYDYKKIKLVLDRYYVDFETFNYSKSISDI